ncbi:MAG: ATP-binding protein [Candidatus Dormibacteria bacterium]
MGASRLLALATLLSFVPLIVLAALSVQIGTTAIRRQVDHRVSTSAGLSSKVVAAHMDDIVHVVSAFAGGPALRAALSEPLPSQGSLTIIQERMAQLHTLVRGSEAAFISDAAGNLKEIEPADPNVVGKSFSQRDWYRGVMASHAPYVSEAYVSAYAGNPLAIGVAAPVFTDGFNGQIVAIVAVIYPTRAIQAFAQEAAGAGEVTLTVVDQRGHLLAGPGLRAGILQAAGPGSQRPGSGTTELSTGGRRVLAGYATVAGLGWTVWSGLDKEHALADAAQLQGNVLTTTAILSLMILAGLIATGVNLGQRRRLEIGLREQFQQSQQLLDVLPVGIFVLGADGRPTYANAMSTKILGRGIAVDATPDELPMIYSAYKAGTDELYPPEKMPLAGALAGEHSRVDDMEIEQPEGRLPIEVWANPIYDEAGAQVAAVAAFLDVSDRRRAQHELREQVQQRQQLLDGLPVGVFVLGNDGRPEYLNKLSMDMFGRGVAPDASPEQLSEVYRLYRAGTDELYIPDELPVVRALAGESVRVDDIEIVRDGGRVSVEVWANPIYDETGELIASVAAFLDVTQSKRAQREILQLNRHLEARVLSRTVELEASNQELEAFSYSVSHDLRAPLRAMAGFAAKLQRKTDAGSDEEIRRYADRIAINAQRMGKLIDELLALSRLSRQELRKESFMPGEIVDRALADLKDEILAAHTEVTVGPMAAETGDPGLIEQVYANLLSNAIKYSRNQPHPSVEIGSDYSADTGTVYFVKDNGAGFDMRFQDKLFGVFQRLHGPEEFEGIGVGLAIVKRIVNRHGGDVSAKGVVNGGATFSFTLGGS